MKRLGLFLCAVCSFSMFLAGCGEERGRTVVEGEWPYGRIVVAENNNQIAKAPISATFEKQDTMVTGVLVLQEDFGDMVPAGSYDIQEGEVVIAENANEKLVLDVTLGDYVLTDMTSGIDPDVPTLSFRGVAQGKEFAILLSKNPLPEK